MDFDWNDPVVAEQMPINGAIVEALIGAIPEQWHAAQLQLAWPPEGGVSQRVVNPETNQGWTVTQELADAALALDGHRSKHGLWWQAARFTVRLNESGDWECRANFE